MTERPFSVLVADDHALSAEGLQRRLQRLPGVEVLPPVHGGLAAIAAARASRPTLAILDYAMPGANGLEVMVEIRRWSPETRCCILTGNSSPSVLSSLGTAEGLFLKSTDPDRICEGVLRVAAGERVRGPGLPDEAEGNDRALSRRERQVLEGIAEGLTNPGIAERLSLSVKTVESHRASLMRKLEVHSTASLLVRAVRDGLIEL